MPEIKTVQSIIKTLVTTKPVNLENINVADLRYLKEDVCEFSGVRRLIKPKKFIDRVLIKKLKNETVSDFGGYRPRFEKNEIDGLLELCKRDKELVLNLVERKAPHYLRGYPQQGRFHYEDIKEFVDLSANDKTFLLDLVNAKSPNNEPAHGARYIKNLLKLSKVDQNTAKKIADMSIPEKVVKNMLDLLETNSKNYRDIIETGLFDLVKEGKVSAEMLDGIGKHKFLSEKVLSNLHKIRNNKSAVEILPKEAAIENISKYVKNGEVCEHNSIIYVNDNGKPVQLNMTKEKFEELFPLLDSSYMRQGDIGDCWLISFLDSIMDKPKGRVTLYNSLRQDGNDIIVKFNGSKKSIRFKNGELNPNKDQIVQGAKGLQFIEQAFAVHRGNNYTKGFAETDGLKALSSNKYIVFQLDSGYPAEAYDAIIADKLTVKKMIKELFSTVRDDLFRKNKHVDFINKYANDNNYALQFQMHDKTRPWNPVIREGIIDFEYDLRAQHAYSLKGYDKTTGNAYISNPWNTEIVTEIPVGKLLEYTNSIVPLKLNV